MTDTADAQYLLAGVLSADQTDAMVTAAEDFGEGRHGVDRNNSWPHHRVAALNLRRLLAMGLTNQNGTWALD